MAMSSPDGAELLALMDLNMVACYRADTSATPGGEVVEAPGLVMFRTPLGRISTNMAIVTGAIEAPAIRALTAEMYRPTDSPFSVWTREHADSALEPALHELGFHQIHREPGMVFVPGAGPAVPPPPGVTIRAVRDDAERAEYGALVTKAFAVYGVPEDSLAEHFATLDSVYGPTTQAFLAWRAGRAVAGAILYMAHGVGGIGWVGTLPDDFRRGYGRAITWAVIEEGFRRGAAFMNLQASPMGEPMYRRMGFTTPTHYRWFLGSE
jgi:ribosomal protein S18 acetylase RimI-like enzyme